jgi:pyridoxamine 5'-phosphate oxidase
MSEMHPLEEIAAAREDAREHEDPMTNLGTLATVDDAGQPWARTLAVREIGPEGVLLTASSLSPKWTQLNRDPRAELVLYYGTLGRQFRIQGWIEAASEEAREKLWCQLSRSSQLVERLYRPDRRQSSPLPSREQLLDWLVEEAAIHPEDAAIPAPESFLALLLVPKRVELWTGSYEDRLHHREEALRGGDGWKRHLLVP